MGKRHGDIWVDPISGPYPPRSSIAKPSQRRASAIVVVWIAAVVGMVLLAFDMKDTNPQVAIAMAQGAIVGFFLGAIAAIIAAIRKLLSSATRFARQSGPKVIETATSVTEASVRRVVDSVKDLHDCSVDRSIKRYEALEKLKSLLDNGAMTEEEYVREKGKLLMAE